MRRCPQRLKNSTKWHWFQFSAFSHIFHINKNDKLDREEEDIVVFSIPREARKSLIFQYQLKGVQKYMWDSSIFEFSEINGGV
jgi:hypothetical protein